MAGRASGGGPIFRRMTSPNTLVVRTFTDRAEGLSHFVLRAGEAPRLLAFDDALGCPVETALAALEWTGAVGILLDDDLLHAARLTSETAAAVIERKSPDGRRFVYIGPRLDAPPMDVPAPSFASPFAASAAPGCVAGCVAFGLSRLSHPTNAGANTAATTAINIKRGTIVSMARSSA